MKKLEQWIGKLMFISILIAVAILLYGGILYLNQHGHELVNKSVFHTEPQQFINLREIWQGAMHNQAQSIIMLGLVAVVIGQVLRVLLTGCIFAYECDWLFSGFTIFILIVLSYNLL